MRAAPLRWEDPRSLQLITHREQPLAKIKATTRYFLSGIDQDKYPHVVEVLSKIESYYDSFAACDNFSILREVAYRVKSIMITQLAQLEESDLSQLSLREELYIEPLSAPLLFPLIAKIKRGADEREISSYAISIAFDQRIPHQDLFISLNFWRDGCARWECIRRIIDKALAEGKQIFPLIEAIVPESFNAWAHLYLGITYIEARTYFFRAAASQLKKIEDEEERLTLVKMMADELESKGMLQGIHLIIGAMKRHDYRVKAYLLLYLAEKEYETERILSNQLHEKSRLRFREAISAAEAIPDFGIKHEVLGKICDSLKARGDEILAYRVMNRLCGGSSRHL